MWEENENRAENQRQLRGRPDVLGRSMSHLVGSEKQSSSRNRNAQLELFLNTL